MKSNRRRVQQDCLVASADRAPASVADAAAARQRRRHRAGHGVRAQSYSQKGQGRPSCRGHLRQGASNRMTCVAVKQRLIRASNCIATKASWLFAVLPQRCDSSELQLLMASHVVLLVFKFSRTMLPYMCPTHDSRRSSLQGQCAATSSALSALTSARRRSLCGP